MSRVLKIMSVAVVLFLAYMWISVLTKSCNKEKEEQVKVEAQTDNGDEFSEEEFFAEDGDTTANSEPVDYKEIDATIEKTVDKTQQNNDDEAAVEETPAEKQPVSQKQTTPPASKPAIKPKAPATKLPPADEVKPTQKLTVPVKKTPATTPTASNDNASASSGSYIVVAGNYLVEANANTMLQKLKKNGFNNAEKVVFDLSEFFTVIAGRYSNQEAAAKSINNLKSKGIDAYLHRKK